MQQMQKKIPDWLIDRLSEYNNIEYVESVFSDSTHKIWYLQASAVDNKNHFLKLCSNTQSPFWSIMQDIFDFNLNIEISRFTKLYALINKFSSLAVPELLKNEVSDKGSFILTSELDGTVVDSFINDQMVRQLAAHLANLHSNTSQHWGTIVKPSFNKFEWNQRLEMTLKKWGGVNLESNKYLKQVLSDCSNIKINNFVPLMPDLRWDQFLQSNNKLTALVDLDAFVYAPRELDFIILEYLLTSDQASVFKEVYCMDHDIPVLNDVRSTYRLLLFFMQILAKKDLDVWMNKECLF